MRRDYKLGCCDKLAGYLASLRRAMLDALPFGDPARPPHHVPRARYERRIDKRRDARDQHRSSRIPGAEKVAATGVSA